MPNKSAFAHYKYGICKSHTNSTSNQTITSDLSSALQRGLGFQLELWCAILYYFISVCANVV